MSKKPTPSKSTKAITINAELRRIWRAAHQVEFLEEVGTEVDDDFRRGVAPFLEDAIETASVALVDSDADMTPLIQRAQGSLATAAKVMPSLEDCLEDTPGACEARAWQTHLVKNAVGILRRFRAKAEAPAVTSLQGYEPYATTPAAQLEEPAPSRLWLVEHLWQRSGTGIVGGSAKGAKTWLCLDLALSIASGTPALDTFPVHRPGGVLFVSAEGGQAYLRERLDAMCRHRGLRLDALPHSLEIIPAAIRIDTEDGLGRLKATIERSRPVLLVLDPFVRLHRIDENSASSVSRLLTSLTELQQAHDLAILVAHHSTKQGSRNGEMSGKAFRGSSDIYAWGDSNIFLGKKEKRFVLSAEHRAAPASEKWTMVATTDDQPRLQIVEDDSEEATVQSRDADDARIDADIVAILRRDGPKSKTELRALIKGSNARVGMRVDALAAQGTLAQEKGRWRLATTNGRARPHAEPS